MTLGEIHNMLPLKGGEKGGSMKVEIQKDWWRSKRMVVLIVTLVMLVGKDMFGLDLSEETVMYWAGIAASYILGQSYEDANKRSAAIMKGAMEVGPKLPNS